MPRRLGAIYRKERAIERRLARGLAKIDGRLRVLKLAVPSQAGYPDRLILGPDKLVLFVELKDEGEDLRPLQQERHHELSELGLSVFTVAGVHELEIFMSLVYKMLRGA